MQCDQDIRYLSLSKVGQCTARMISSGTNNFGIYSLLIQSTFVHFETKSEKTVETVCQIPPTKVWFPLQCDYEIWYLGLSKAHQCTARIFYSSPNILGRYCLVEYAYLFFRFETKSRKTVRALCRIPPITTVWIPTDCDQDICQRDTDAQPE